jgi:hypothetical protein
MTLSPLDKSLGVFDMIQDSTRAIRVSMAAYNLARDNPAIPKGLKAVSEELRFVFAILEDAETQWDVEGGQPWLELVDGLSKCRGACNTMQEVVVSAYAQLGKGNDHDDWFLEKEAEEARGLLKEICEVLRMLAGWDMVMDCHAVLRDIEKVAYAEGQ